MANYYDRVQGMWYTEFLEKIHKILQPSTYFEVGSRTGGSLLSSQCATIAVDPGFDITLNVIGKKPSFHAFQMTSDAFFRDYNPSDILGKPIDLAFLDGMHLAEFLVRDFYNTERHARRNSVIAIHDCVPGELIITTREETDARRADAERPSWWTGDVWKIIPILKKYRPDLHILALDCAPTGLVLVSNLEPSNTVLFDNYNAIMDDDIRGQNGGEAFRSFWEHLDVTSSELLSTEAGMFAHFWL